MKIKTYRFFRNIGGMNLRFNDLLLDEREAEDIINLHASPYGSWSSQGIGYQVINGSPVEEGAEITGLYEYITLDGTAHFMVSAGTKLLTMEPGSGTLMEIASGLTAGATVNFVTFNGLLIACNGSNAPRKWDGSGSVANLDGWPPTIAGVSPGNPAFGEKFANRVVFSGDSANPSMIYISELENPENFTPASGATSAGAIQVSPGDGERITGLKTLYLPLENEEVLVIFKERSTYMLIGHDADTFAIQKISDEFGAVSHQSVVLAGSELLFLSREGMTSLSTATVQGNLTTGFISDRIRPTMNRLNQSALSGSLALHIRSRQEIWWFVPEGSITRNNLVLVYNYGHNNAWSRRTGIEAACAAVINGAVYTGNYGGDVQQQLTGNTYNGEAIAWRYRTPFYNFSSPHVRKRVKDIVLYFRQIASLDITVKSAWDMLRAESLKQSATLTVAPDENSALFGTAVYGDASYDLPGTSILRLIPSGSGRLFQLEFSGDTVDKPVEIEGWSITVILGGER